MRDIAAATFANPPAPQAPARNPSPRTPQTPSSVETYNSHRRVKRPRLGDRRVYRPVRRHTLSRIDETPPPARPRSKSLQHSGDFSSTRQVLRSRSNISADTSRSVPVCNQSQDVDSASPQYAEPKGYESGSSDERSDRPASMSDLPIVGLDPATGAYVPYAEYAYYGGARRSGLWWKRRKAAKPNNLFLAFMY